MSGRRALRVGLQLVLGLIILASGVGKALDLRGFVSVLVTYRIVPPILLWPAAAGVTIFEIVLGGWLLSGRALRLAALLSIALNALYAAMLTLSLLRGLDLKNCGCFGVFLARPLTWESPLEDVVMIALSLGLLLLATPSRGAAPEATA